MYPTLLIYSRKALEEFINYQPTKIDKMEGARGVPKFITESFANKRTTKLSIERRKNLTKWLHLNNTSSYIGNMISCCEDFVKDLKEGQKYDAMHMMNILAFNIFTQIFFGDDVSQLTDKLHPYITDKGVKEDICLREMLSR